MLPIFAPLGGKTAAQLRATWLGLVNGDVDLLVTVHRANYFQFNINIFINVFPFSFVFITITQMQPYSFIVYLYYSLIPPNQSILFNF